MSSSKSPSRTAELVQGEPDPVVGDPALGEIVGADALIAHSGAHLAAALAGDGLLLFPDGVLVEPGSQDSQGPVLVFVLAPLVLALHHGARWAGG